MASSATTEATSVAQSCRALAARLLELVATTPDRIEALLSGLLAGGHLLIEGVPGIGKTLLAKALARSIGVDLRRIQFTNDLMPSDVIGSSIWRPESGRCDFVPGPLFADLVLADEINRTSPRTLSCLLEAMEAGSVTVDGKAMRLGEPFTVLATRNPIEFHGTQPMPEAALDRFMLRVGLGYPTHESEIALYQSQAREAGVEALTPLLSRSGLLSAMRIVRSVHVSYEVAAYCHAVVQATRAHEGLTLGGSPRAALSWLMACRGRAFLHDRKYVLPDDLKALIVQALGHRVQARGSASTAEILQEIAVRTPVPL
jgi:MoxR-like ATPase